MATVEGRSGDDRIAGHERRIAGGHRVELGQEASLLRDDGQVLPVLVKNLSRGGFCFQHRAADLEVGDIVSISSRRGTAAIGKLEWVTSSEAGGRFLDLAPDLR